MPLIAFAIWALNRLLGGESAAAKQAKAQRQARVNPPPPPGDKQRVDDEVSEFLRRAAQQRGAAGHTRTPQPPQPPVMQPGSRAHAKGNLRGRRGGKGGGPAADAHAKVSDPLGERALAESAVDAKEVVQAETAMQSHLSQVFDHRVGTLSGGQMSTSAPEGDSSIEPAAKSSRCCVIRSIRDAIIVSEVLRRPTERRTARHYRPGFAASAAR